MSTSITFLESSIRVTFPRRKWKTTRTSEISETQWWSSFRRSWNTVTIFPHTLFPLKTPSLLFHTVGTHSPRQSRTQNRCSRTCRSKHSRTSIRGQTDGIKWSSLHFSRQGGVDGIRVNESWSYRLSVIRSYARNLLLINRTTSVSKKAGLWGL